MYIKHLISTSTEASAPPRKKQWYCQLESLCQQLLILIKPNSKNSQNTSGGKDTQVKVFFCQFSGNVL